jgi:hypothetical protein
MLCNIAQIKICRKVNKDKCFCFAMGNPLGCMLSTIVTNTGLSIAYLVDFIQTKAIGIILAFEQC